MFWCGYKPVEIVKTAAQALKEKRRLKGRGREKNTVAVVVMMIMLQKDCEAEVTVAITFMLIIAETHGDNDDGMYSVLTYEDRSTSLVLLHTPLLLLPTLN